MQRQYDIGTSVLTSTLRLWSGTWGKLAATAPVKLLELFDREDDPQCRLVREVLTELNIDALIYPCPLGGQRFLRRRTQLHPHGKSAVPLLFDPNTEKVLQGPEEIITYLFAQYAGHSTPPARLRDSAFNRVSSSLASMARGPIHAEASIAPKKKLTLYSFESSPFSRLVRERLCALELHYQLINVGKLNWGEMGPATRRLAPGPYQPEHGSKREEFLHKFGKVQLPFLIDPNHKTQLFESRDIIHYLDQHYAKSVQR
ncbi:MAG: glutathione S-transferase N-terminal domain-containing protein [Burkholderiales bacterium]|nr:glutathione S-transferase N-terminal domain-containing protein [Burkholderiales bacterium]